MAMCDFAVVVPVYNRPSLVLETLDSIAGQSLLPRRLIIVDDASTDGTVAAVADWVRRNPLRCDTRLIRQPRNSGPAAAVNRGLELAQDCRYFAVLDSDDRWPPDFVARTYNMLSARPDAVAATCDQMHIFGCSQESRLIDAHEIEGNAASWIFTACIGIVSATMVSTKDILALGGANERLATGHDNDLLLGLSLRGPWLYVPGRPAAIRRPTPHSDGETVHVSANYRDSHRRWAQIHDDFIRLRGGHRMVPREIYTRALADRWDLAGRQLMEFGRPAEARRCFMRSIAWRPWRTKTWSRLLGTRFAARRMRMSDRPASLPVAALAPVSEAA